MLLSKVIDENNVPALVALNMRPEMYVLSADREAHRFIMEYSSRNGGQAPSYAAVLEAVPEFNYYPSVTDNYSYLNRMALNDACDEEFSDFVNEGDFAKIVEEYRGNMTILLDKLAERMQAMKVKYDPSEKVGASIKDDTAWFLDEYRRRAAGLSHKTWKSRYAAVGRYIGGNVYVVYGESGRGKSVTTVADCITAAMQGAKVLIWSMEMTRFEVFVRMYSILSADAGVVRHEYAGLDLTGGFDSTDLREGTLTEEFLTMFQSFLDSLNDMLPGNVTVRAVDDPDFNTRNLATLESDITKLNADFVLIDPFYYLDYERNVDNTTGGAASNTSKELRKLAGRMKTVIIAITQADIEKKKRNIGVEFGRELSLPARNEVKKTASLTHDAYQLIAVDTDYKQGRGIVGVNKGRDGGEGEYSEITYLPQFGIVRPLTIEDELLQEVLGM